MTYVRSTTINYATIERLATSYRLRDRAAHLPLIGFMLGGGIATLLWVGIVWGLRAALS